MRSHAGAWERGSLNGLGSRTSPRRRASQPAGATSSRGTVAGRGAAGSAFPRRSVGTRITEWSRISNQSAQADFAAHRSDFQSLSMVSILTMEVGRVTAEQRRVVITGLGAITPLGLDVPTTWASVLQGRSEIDRITAFDPSPYKTQIAAEVKGFDPARYLDGREARRLDRFTHFAVAASYEAVADARLDIAAEDPRQVGVMIGSALGGVITLLREYDVLRERGPRSPGCQRFRILLAASRQSSGQSGPPGQPAPRPE